MLLYAVFFADEAAVGMTRVEASDAAASEALVLDQHPGGVNLVNRRLLAGENEVIL